MDRYGKRLLLAALLIGAAALCATLLQPSGAAAPLPEQPALQRLSAQPAAELLRGAEDAPQTEADEMPPTEAAQQSEAGDAPATEAAVQTEADDGHLAEAAGETAAAEAEGLSAVLRTEPGRAVKLLRPDGQLLQRLTADGQGEATFSGLAPGSYRIESDRAGGSFRLLENAAVEAVSGTLWSDGELLHLENTPTVRLRVEFFTQAEQEGQVVTVRLTSKAGTVYDRSLIAGKPDFYAVEFACLKPGDYRLRINGRVRATLSVTSEPEQTFRLWTE